MKLKRINNNIGLLFVLILSIPSILPFFSPGFFPMHDDTQVARVYEMGKALHDGMFPVRWVSDLGYGYGYPIFNFYSPLPYYIGGLLTILGFDALLATKLTFMIGIILSGIFMYLFVRRFSSGVGAVVSALLYVYFPYHAVNIYVRGALGELYAYAFLPIVFLGLYKIYEVYQDNLLYRDRNKGGNKYGLYGKIFPFGKKWILVTSLGVTLVLLSHNLYSFILLISLIVFIFLAVFFIKKAKLLLFFGTALFLGFILSSFYVLPAIFEMQYTNVESQVGGGAAFFDHFVCFPQLWESLWGYGGSTKSCVDGMSFRIGKLQILLFIGAFVLFVYSLIMRNKIKHYFIYCSAFILSLFSLFMMLPFSEFVWKIIPAFAFIQYPWRFLGFFGFFSCIFIIYIFSSFKNRLYEIGLGIAVIIILLFLNQKLFVPHYIYSSDSSFYTRADYLRWNISKISDEYLPKDFVKPQNNGELPSGRLSSDSKDFSIETLSEKTHRYKYRTYSSQPYLLTINIAYFPSWEIIVDGKSLKTSGDANKIVFLLPAGEHIVEAFFDQTVVEKLSNFLTLLGILVVFIGIIENNRNSSYAKKTS